MTELSKKPSYRADIQGLRGIAVLLVVIYHSGLPLWGGFIGVDVFFVLSGFVITEGMLRALGKGTFSFADFYTKRVRRLLPALAVMLNFVLLAMFWLGPPISRLHTGRTAVAASLLNANHYLIRGPSYFEPIAEYNALLHTWSLSVEEQFYLLFPFALFLLWRFGGEQGRERRLMLGVGVLSVASFVLCVWWSYTDRLFGFEGIRLAFYTVLTRSWQFGAGVLIALVAPSLARSVFARSWSGWVGLAMILAAALFFDKGTVFPGYAALLPTLGAALALISGMNSERMGLVSRALSYRPLVRIGDLSYSWYLWHWPLIVFAAATFPHRPLAASVGAAAISLVAAKLSEQFVENPVRFGNAQKFGGVGVLSAAFLLPTAILLIVNPVVESMYRRGVNDALVQVALGDRARVPQSAVMQSSRAEEGLRVGLVGDSNAEQHSPALEAAIERIGGELLVSLKRSCFYGDVLDISSLGDKSKKCHQWAMTSIEEMLSENLDVVFISNAVDEVMYSDVVLLHDEERADTLASRRQLLAAAVSKTVQRFESAGTRVVLINPIPKFIRVDGRWGDSYYNSRTFSLVRRCSILSLAWSPEWCVVRRTIPGDGAWLSVRESARIYELASSERTVIMDLSDDLCGSGECVSWDLDTGDSFWGDATHLTPAGSLVTLEAFIRTLEHVGKLGAERPTD